MKKHFFLVVFLFSKALLASGQDSTYETSKLSSKETNKRNISIYHDSVYVFQIENSSEAIAAYNTKFDDAKKDGILKRRATNLIRYNADTIRRDFYIPRQKGEEGDINTNALSPVLTSQVECIPRNAFRGRFSSKILLHKNGKTYTYFLRHSLFTPLLGLYEKADTEDRQLFLLTFLS